MCDAPVPSPLHGGPPEPTQRVKHPPRAKALDHHREEECAQCQRRHMHQTGTDQQVLTRTGKPPRTLPPAQHTVLMTTECTNSPGKRCQAKRTASVMGVSTTRRSPYLASSPLVTLYAPLYSATSSPITYTSAFQQRGTQATTTTRDRKNASQYPLQKRQNSSALGAPRGALTGATVGSASPDQ